MRLFSKPRHIFGARSFNSKIALVQNEMGALGLFKETSALGISIFLGQRLSMHGFAEVFNRCPSSYKHKHIGSLCSNAVTRSQGYVTRIGISEVFTEVSSTVAWHDKKRCHVSSCWINRNAVTQ